MTEASRHLSDAEALMWSLDDVPALRSSFMGVTLLDRPPDRKRLRRRMLEATESVAALRLRVAEAPCGLAPPRWELDPAFDIDHHLHHMALSPPGDRRQLLDLASAISAEQLDRTRPLWDFRVVEGLDDGGCALLSKMHHVLSDGIGAVRISASFLDLTPDGSEGNVAHPRPASAPAPSPSPLAQVTTMIGANLAQAGKLASTLLQAARSPAVGISVARSMGRQIGLTDGARSPLWTDRSYTHRFEMLSLDLDRMRGTAHALGGTANDAFVTVMAAAAGEYHRSLGTPVDELRISMPVSVRHDHDAGGNAWVPARVLLPTGDLAPADRFAEVSARLSAVRHESSLGMASALAGVVRHLPRPLLLPLARQQVGTVDFACSNVRGAPFDLWIAGAHVEANHPMGPTAGVAFNATVLSYRESLDLGLNMDTGAVTDPDLLRCCIEEATEELLGSA
jgi:diacylglycerol O-acyltransferase / wax synthase